MTISINTTAYKGILDARKSIVVLPFTIGLGITSALVSTCIQLDETTFEKNTPYCCSMRCVFVWGERGGLDNILG